MSPIGVGDHVMDYLPNITDMHLVDNMNALYSWMSALVGTCGVNIHLSRIRCRQHVANTRAEATRICVRWQFWKLEWLHHLLFVVGFGGRGNEGPHVVAENRSSSHTLPSACFQAQVWEHPDFLMLEGIGCQEVSPVQEEVRVSIDTSNQGDDLRRQCTSVQQHQYIKWYTDRFS